MHIVSLVSGILGLVCLAITVPVGSGLLAIAGAALPVLALATGIASRRKRAGLTGLILGSVGLLVVALGILRFAPRDVSVAPQPAPVSTAPPR